MKRLEIIVPKKQADEVKEVVSEYTDDITTDEVEKEDKKFTEVRVTLDSDVIDEITEELKGLTDLESGDLTIDILEQRAMIEKGKRHEGGSTEISVQEMYSKAFEFSTYNTSSWALIALAAGIAVFGVVMENVMVVIGAMVIAPMLGPFISLSFGIVVGDRRLIQDSVFYGILSLFFGIAIAFILALLMSSLISGTTALMQLIANPGFMTVPLSLLVGSAAALTFTTELRESLAGVAVAIALVPPAAVSGISLAMLDFALFRDVSLVLLTNVTALILAGSVTFKLFGITPSTYYRQKVSEKEMRKILGISLAAIIVLGAVVGYLSYQDLQTENLQATIETELGAALGQTTLFRDVSVTQSSVVVELAAVNPSYTVQELEELLAEYTDRDVNVRLIAVNGTVEE